MKKELPPIGSKIRWINDRLGWKIYPDDSKDIRGEAVSMRGMIGTVTAHYPGMADDGETVSSFGAQFEFSPYEDGSIAPWLIDEGKDWERVD